MGPPLGQRLPAMMGPPPAARGRALIDRLAASECPAFTARRARRRERAGVPHDPIVWVEARGANVVDADGNRYVDLTGGFGAAAVGHAHPRVVEAVRAQAGRLLHALGDLHPSDVKIELAERLAKLAPFPDARVILGLSGSDAVEAALKTALLHTGKPGILAFDGGYHGLAHGPLAACGYRATMREPFSAQLNPHVVFAPFPDAGAEPERALFEVARTWDGHPSIGAILIEPIQGRGGVRVPPRGFLEGLGGLARTRGAVVVADEILTGFGRTGSLFRAAADGLTPDLLCTGKALGGGLPVSACLGRADVMAAWGTPDGEALHTGTFFGHPLGSAAALATLDVLEGEALVARAAEVGRALLDILAPLRRHEALTDVRGAGLLVGLVFQMESDVLRLCRSLLERGYLVLPAGTDGRVIELAPPLTIDLNLLSGFAETLDSLLGAP